MKINENEQIVARLFAVQVCVNLEVLVFAKNVEQAMEIVKTKGVYHNGRFYNSPTGRVSISAKLFIGEENWSQNEWENEKKRTEMLSDEESKLYANKVLEIWEKQEAF